MSEATSELEERLARHRKLQNGMELILGKLRHNAKSITTEDARSLADNAEDGDEWTANIIAAVEDIAARNDMEKAALIDERPRALEISSESQSTLSVSQDVIKRLRSDPGSITEEDARRFSENVEARDASSARLVSAVESLAAAHNDIYGQSTNITQSAHPSILTVVKDLYAAVETNPEDVDTEILRTTQSIVSKMQKAIGHTNAPHPELEAELQQEYAKIVLRVERGTVTKAEADRLHSLEARAHGHTERGGLTAIAQSVAARCDRRSSICSTSGIVRSRANSRTFTPFQNMNTKLPEAETEVSGAQNCAVPQHGVDTLHSQEQRSPEHGGAPVAMPPVPTTRRYQSLSESTNTTGASIEDSHKHSSMNSRLAGLSVYDEERDNSEYNTASFKFQTHNSVDTASVSFENRPRSQKHENSHPSL